MSHKLTALQSRMLEISDANRASPDFKADLELDVFELYRFENIPSRQFVWLLRPTGSIIVPVGLGVDPIHITHKIWSEAGTSVKAYKIDISLYDIEKISHEEAERLIMLPPNQISACMSKGELASNVSEVLKNGISHNLWGAFPPKASNTYHKWNWDNWLTYFNSTGNRLMQSYMGKALRLMSDK